MKKGTANGGRVLTVLLVIFLLYPLGRLWAWKSKTHVHLALLAREDALDDGQITLYEMDYENGQILRDAAGRPKVFGVYAIDPWILTALRQYPDHYKAGALGPDAFPDLLTGQTGIHPDNRAIGFNISDDWLKRLWNEAQKMRSNQVKAFVVGFLCHAAGDLYGHPFVNHYSGGPFQLGENALKHIVLESYIDKRTPQPQSDFYNFSITGVEDFIYRQLVVSDLIPPTDALSIATQTTQIFNYAPPRIFKSLQQMVTLMQAALKSERTMLAGERNDKLRQARACATSDPGQAARLTAEAAGLKATDETLHVVVAYVQAWLADIVSGQKAWPQFAADFAAAGLINPAGFDQDQVGSICQDFTNHHLLSMLVFPDMVGESMAVAKALSDFIDRFIPPWMKELMDLMRSDLETYLLMKAWGVTWDVIKRPEVHFDPVMNNRLSTNTGQRISLREFNRSVLGINDDACNTSATYDWQRIPAMCNSLTMMKLLMLSREGLGRLLNDLEARGYTANTLEPQITLGADDVPLILGFMHSLDENSQWCGERKMLLARDGCVYRKLFLAQEYSGQPSCIEPCENPADGSVTTVPVEQVLATTYWVNIVKQDGHIWEWGRELAESTQINIPETAPIQLPPGLLPPVVAVYAAAQRFGALAQDGSVWLWGIGAYFLYNGSTSPRPWQPLMVPNLASITQLALGNEFALALRSNGTVWSWGADSNAQLGQGPGWHIHQLPRRVRGLDNIKTIAAGSYHGLAVSTLGLVYAWGSNFKGQLGDGGYKDNNLARLVPGLNGVLLVAAGSFHSLALKADGTVWGWGWNEYHQLADGTAANRLQPVQIKGLSQVKMLAAGHKFSAALSADGTVWVWGDNEFRQRGESGMPRFMDQPMRVVGIPPMRAIAAWANHMLGLDQNDRIWVWGDLRMAAQKLPPLK